MRIIKNLLLITLPVMIVLIIVIEIILRIFFPVPDPFARFKDRYEHFFIPSQMPSNARYKLTSREELRNMDTAMVYTTNNIGFRGDSLALPKPANEYRVFIVGGSTAQCLYIDDSKAIGSVLQEELQKSEKDRTVKVYTAAKSGDATPDHIAMLSQRIIHLQPDLVIVFCGINDLRKSIQHHDFAHLSSSKMYTPAYMHMLATDFQVGRRLYYIIKRRTDQETREAVPLETNYRQLFAIEQRTPVSDSVPFINAKAYSANLRTIAGICAGNRVPLILIPNQSTWGVPAMQDKHWLATCGKVRYREDRLKSGLAVFNDTMRSVAGERGIPVFDLPSEMEPGEECFYDDCHFNAVGSEECGRRLSSFIINNKLSDTTHSVSTFKYK